jgi:hypothetical protein
LTSGAAGFTIDIGDGNGYQNPESVITSGSNVIVTASGGSPSYTLSILEREKYVAVKLLDAEGVSEDDGSALQLSIKRDGDLGLKTFDDLVTIGGNSVYTRIDWEYAWHERFTGSRGGIAIYDGSLSGSNLDLALADIWSTESEYDMPRPAGQTSWTSTDVLNWVDEFATKFANQTKAAVQATTEEELYTMTDEYVIPNGFKRVYLHCATWRGQYYLVDQSIDDVNTNVFPAGQSDLKAYGDYLHAHGIQLHLHNLALSIGREDPEYIVGTVDRRLANWGSGTLASGITSSSSTIQFTPDSGVVYPPTLCWNVDWSLYIRIDEELIQLTDIDTSGSVWVGTVSQRGFVGTDPASHEADAEVVGIWCPNGKTFIPADDLEQPDSLTDEMAQKYASLINYAGLDQIHFDGMRFHDFKPWTAREMASHVYSLVNRPATSSQVGSVIDANFEYEFSQNRDNETILYTEIFVDLRDELDATDECTDLAMNWLGANFIAQEPMLEARGVVMGRSGSANGLTVDLMKNHGFAAKTLLLFQHWKAIAPVFTDADRAYVSAVMEESDTSHLVSEDVLVLERNDSNQFVFTPNRVLGRAEDDPFGIIQEKGTVWRRQIIDVGDTLSDLYNPYAEQELTFFIRNRYDTDTVWTNPFINITDSGSITITGSISPGESLEYTGGDTAHVLDKNMNVIAALPVESSSFTVPTGYVSIRVEGTGSASLDIQFITKGTPYVLEANDSLPQTYSVLVDKGRGSGDYSEGTAVEINANIPSGAVFEKWTGDVATIDNVYNSTTTLTVPSDSIEVAAQYFVSENVSLGQSASQSSTNYDGVASLAVDGNTDGAYNHDSVTHTDEELNPWWEVDLGDNYTIGEIWVWNRTDTSSMGRLTNFTVSVVNSSGDTTWSETVNDYPDPSVTLDAKGASGSVVRVQINGVGIINLAEVEVYTGLSTLTAADAYPVWIAGYGLSGVDSLLLADSENGGIGDGYNNLAEFALGMNPTVSDAGSRETVGAVTLGGTNWFEYVHYRRSDYLEQGLNYLLIDSTNLVHSTTHTNAQDQILFGDAVGGYAPVTNRYRIDDHVKFIRINIQQD